MQRGELIPAGEHVRFARLGARCLQPHVVDLQREDREAIDHRPGGLARAPRLRQAAHALELREQASVDRLDRVVAPLVGAVDGALAAHDLGGRDVVAPRAVLGVVDQATARTRRRRASARNSAS